MGLISLCHPDENKSCGACCGLYNWIDNSRKTLSDLMHERRDRYIEAGGGGDSVDAGAMDTVDIAALKRRLENIKTPETLFDVIHNCPFVGFIDDERKRVGCMIHPVNNGGVEMRDVSFYGAKLCNGHECPSFTSLTSREKEAVSVVIDDWYLYGLVITDIDFVKEFFTITANRIGEGIDPERVTSPAVKAAASDFFRLKETWPFVNGEKRFGKYSFSAAEYRIEREVAKRGLKIPSSPHEKIFLSLASDFKTREEARRAEEVVDGLLSEFIRAYEETKWTIVSGEKSRPVKGLDG